MKNSKYKEFLLRRHEYTRVVSKIDNCIKQFKFGDNVHPNDCTIYVFRKVRRFLQQYYKLTKGPILDFHLTNTAHLNLFIDNGEIYFLLQFEAEERVWFLLQLEGGSVIENNFMYNGDNFPIEFMDNIFN